MSYCFNVAYVIRPFLQYFIMEVVTVVEKKLAVSLKYWNFYFIIIRKTTYLFLNVWFGHFEQLLFLVFIQKSN